jgi:tetratricopeptide (TPR) repeat protein
MRPIALLLIVGAALFFCPGAGADEAGEARALFAKAQKAVASRDFKSAAALLEKAVRLQPRNDTYLGNLGYVEGQLGRHRSALEHSEKAIRLNDKVHYYFANAASSAHRLGEHAKALQYSEKALSFGRAKLGDAGNAWMVTVRDRSRIGALHDKARAAEKRGKFKDAVALMAKAVEIVPNDAQALGYLAMLEHRTGQHASGLAHAEKAIALDGKRPWHHVSAATHARELGDFAKAQSHARKALAFKAPTLSAEGSRLMKELLASFQLRTYTIRWKLDPSKGWGEKGRGKGPFYVPAPSTGLPYQSATFSVRGARSHKLVTRDGARMLLVESDDNKPIHLTAEVTVRFHDYRPKIKAGPNPRYPNEVRPYLGPSARIDPDNKKVRALAARLKGETQGATINNFLVWLKNNMTYRIVPFESVDEVMERGHGDCGAYSALFVGLCRTSGIPAREVSGAIKTKMVPPGHLGAHVWAEVYMPGAGWVPVEPQNLNGFGHMPLGYVRLLHHPVSSQGWPAAMSAVVYALHSMGADTPVYEEKRLSLPGD